MKDASEITLAAPIGYYREQWVRQEPKEALPTGLAQLDNLLGGGLLNGQVFTVGAETSHGKSAFGTTLACNCAKVDRPVVLFTFEMTVQALAARINQMHSGVSSIYIQTKQLTDDELIRVQNADLHMAEYKLYLSYGSDLSAENIAGVMKRYVDELGIELFIFDYIQEMASGGEGKQFKIEEMMRAIRHGAKEVCDRPVCVLSQLNRAAGYRDEPYIHDLRDSGAIENNSDVVLLLSPACRRPWFESVEFRLHVVKQREGACGVVTAEFIPERVTFMNSLQDGECMLVDDVDEYVRTHPSMTGNG